MNVYIGWPASQQVTNYVPQMTANTQDWYTATCSTQLSSDFYAWMAFYVSTQWSSYSFHSNAIWSWNRWWSQIQLPKWIIVNKIEIWARKNESSSNLRPIGAFSLKWSNDWSTWTEIKAVSWLWSSWSIWSVQSWNITGQTTAYTYLKLEVQAYSSYVAFDYWNIDWVVEEVPVLKNAYIGEYNPYHIVECDFTQSDNWFTFVWYDWAWGSTSYLSYGRDSNWFYMTANQYGSWATAWKIPSSVYSQWELKKVVLDLYWNKQQNWWGICVWVDTKTVRVRWTGIDTAWWGTSSVSWITTPANTKYQLIIDLENWIASTSINWVTLDISSLVSWIESDWSAGNMNICVMVHPTYTTWWIQKATFYLSN